MPRKVDPAKIAHATELYTSGKSFREAAAEVGMDPESLRLILKRRGVVARPAGSGGRPAHNRRTLPDAEIVEAYRTGESELALANRFGVDRGVIRRRLVAGGVEIRGNRDAGKLRYVGSTAEQRSAITAAAHDAVRGTTLTEEHLVRMAQAKEAAGRGRRFSRHEESLNNWLREHGVNAVREKAVGKYNIDLAIAPIAVEVLGGNWHAYKATHAQRTPYILNEGWMLLFVWAIRRAPLCVEAGEYIVALADEARRNPALRGQYRVIRGDGKLVASGCADDNEFPLVPPSVRGFRGWPLD